jgi:hypothetical protein
LRGSRNGRLRSMGDERSTVLEDPFQCKAMLILEKSIK